MVKLQILGFVVYIIANQVHAVSDENFEQKGLKLMGRDCYDSPLCTLIEETLHRAQRREADKQIEDDPKNPKLEELQEHKPLHRVARQVTPKKISINIAVTPAPAKAATKKEESAKIKLEGVQPIFNFQITTAKPAVAVGGGGGGNVVSQPGLIKLGGNQPAATQPPNAVNAFERGPITIKFGNNDVTTKAAPVVVAPVVAATAAPVVVVTAAPVGVKPVIAAVTSPPATTLQPLLTGSCLTTPYEEPEGVTVNIEQMVKDANDEASRDQTLLPVEKINEVFFAGFALGYDPGSATMLTMALSNGQEYEAMYDDIGSFGEDGGDEYR